jgi:restriction system protein
MADVTLDTIGELLRNMFEVLWSKPDGVPAREILAILPDSPAAHSVPAGYSPVTQIPENERTLRLATLPLVKAGWLVRNDKARWYLTEEGRQACRRYPNAQELYKEAVRLLEEKEQSAPLYALALEDAQEKAWDLIRRYLQESRRVEFQALVAELLKAMGYHVAWVAPPEKVHGQIDMLAHVDPIGVKGPRILVQVKTKGQAVTLEGLKSFLLVLGPNDYGLFISTGGFTSDVMQQIKTNTFQKTTLLDLEGFFDLWLKYYDELSQDARKRFPLKAVHFLYGIE